MSSNDVLKTKGLAVYSRPSFQQLITLNSLWAQRAMTRAFSNVSRALYFIDVIMHIVGNGEYTDSIERLVLEKINKQKKGFDQEEQRFDKLLGDNGIDRLPDYDHPVEYKIEISGPQLVSFAAIIKQLDALTIKVDALWLNSILDNKQRLQASQQLFQRVIKLGNQIIGMEGHARKSIQNFGKQAEVEQQLGAEVIALLTEKIAP